ncbi:unannotated protein [freshwater metagenome]|uniref:Unannotated protein n=1 Tax=freshwater metagenome TaxID=449393 RepID=A0A6J7MJU6_9ZZZZ
MITAIGPQDRSPTKRVSPIIESDRTNKSAPATATKLPLASAAAPMTPITTTYAVTGGKYALCPPAFIPAASLRQEFAEKATTSSVVIIGAGEPGESIRNPTEYATCASRNAERPGTNRSDGSIKKMSPMSDRTSAATNQARIDEYLGSRASATPIKRISTPGLATYSMRLFERSTAHQSTSATTPARRSIATARGFTRSHQARQRHQTLRERCLGC